MWLGVRTKQGSLCSCAGMWPQESLFDSGTGEVDSGVAEREISNSLLVVCAAVVPGWVAKRPWMQRLLAVLAK